MKFKAINPAATYVEVGDVIFGNTGEAQHDLELETLPDSLIIQLCYHVFQTKVLACEDPETLQNRWNYLRSPERLSAVVPQTQVQAPLQQVEPPTSIEISTDRSFEPVIIDQVMDQLLSKPVATIRKHVRELKAEDLEFLLDLESSRKNRKTVISLLKKRLDKLNMNFGDVKLTEEVEVIEVKQD